MAENETSPAAFYEYQVAVKLWKICPPTMILLGTIGNIFCLIVLSQKSIRKSTTCIYLIALAVNDLLVLYTGLLRQWIKNTFDIDVRRFSEASCKFHLWLVYLSVDTSAWILVMVTLERVALVWFPHASKSRCTKKLAIIVLASTIATLMLINCHLMYGIGDVIVYNNNQSTLKTCFYENEAYGLFYKNVWPWIDLAVFNAIPFTVIVIGNVFIIACLVHKNKKKRTTIRPQEAQSNHQNTKINSMTMTLIALNTAFLVSTTPISVYLAFYNKWSRNATVHDNARLELAWAVVNILMYMNNTFNFLLYCGSGSRFRMEVKKLFCRGKKNKQTVASTRTCIQPATSTAFPLTTVSPQVTKVEPLNCQNID